MKLPNWFRILWWLLLLAIITVLLGYRVAAICSGQATFIDGLLIILWIALFLVPIFQEVSLFGVTLKQQVEEVKDEITGLRNEIRTNIDFHAQVNPVIHLQSPPPDSQLPELEGRLKNMLEGVLRTYGIQHSPIPLAELKASDDLLVLFQARYQLEKEIRRIWDKRLPEPDTTRRRTLPVVHILKHLSSEGLIDMRLTHVIREVYSVSSPAIHGEPFSRAQVDFVKDVAPDLISTLRAIEPN
jgi:hypothetical protein